MRKMMAKSVGANIRACRKRRGFTQEDLSDKAGIHYTFLGHIERGSKLPSIPTLLRIAAALRCPPGKLFKGLS